MANREAKHFTFIGSFDGAIKIRGRWVRAVELNRIDKTGWVRWAGPPSAAIVKAMKNGPPTQAYELFPHLAIKELLTKRMRNQNEKDMCTITERN